jgi:hypothetical protein
VSDTRPAGQRSAVAINAERIEEGARNLATVGVMGPIQRDDPLGPGESRWVPFGEAEGFGSCALSVSASPHEGTGGTTHVLKVDDVNITGIVEHKGDLSFPSWSAGCNVTNTGETTVTIWSVLVGVIVP